MDTSYWEYLFGVAGVLILMALAFPVCYGVVMLSLFAVEWVVVYVARKLGIEEYSEGKYVHIIQKMNNSVSDSNSPPSRVKKSP